MDEWEKVRVAWVVPPTVPVVIAGDLRLAGGLTHKPPCRGVDGPEVFAVTVFELVVYVPLAIFGDEVGEVSEVFQDFGHRPVGKSESVGSVDRTAFEDVWGELTGRVSVEVGELTAKVDLTPIVGDVFGKKVQFSVEVGSQKGVGFED